MSYHLPHPSRSTCWVAAGLHVSSWRLKNPPASAGGLRDEGLIPGLGRCPEGGHANPLQYSYLENPMDRRAWQATVHGVTKNQTRLKWLSNKLCLSRTAFKCTAQTYLSCLVFLHSPNELRRPCLCSGASLQLVHSSLHS